MPDAFSIHSAAALPLTAELLERFDKPGPRYTSYPTAVEFTPDFTEADYREALARAAKRRGPLSLYTHLPFCEQRCWYCACNVVITSRQEVAAAYLQRLEREIAMVAPLLGERREVGQFHLGGGTPTYYAPEVLSSLMRTYREHFHLLPNAEVAVELDPRVTTREHLETLAREGFNRLSLGVQDFDPRVQEAVQRLQSFEVTAELVQEARALGMDAINIDLIYGLPHQTPASFARTLEQTLALRPARLAVYSFAYVPWLKPHQRRLDEAALPKGREKLELLVLARERLLAAGYVAIGMDHFALPGDELARAQAAGALQRNFMGYTTARADDLVGFGLSAIGSVGGAFAQNPKKLSRYYAAIDEGQLATERGVSLTNDDLIRAHAIREWMCNFKLDFCELERRFGIVPQAYFAHEFAALAEFEAGFVRLSPRGMVAGPLGRLFPRNVAMVFDRYRQQPAPAQPRFSRTV